MDEHVIILCPACGAECTSEATFCGACGSALMLTPERAQEGTAPLANNDAPATPAPVAALDPTLTAIESPAGPAPAAEPAFAPQPDAAGGSATAERPVDAAQPQAQAAPGTIRRCNWCGTESPADVQRCPKCDAMFPTAETDAAYLAAGEERIRGVQESLEHMRRTWRRRGFGRLFED